jgi:pimeloyl-ACP methyl ester carboxylesterase
MIVTPKPQEQTRARYPGEEGYVERDGVRVFYEVYGDAPTTFLLFPTSPISHSRLWKAQIPYLSRHFRVITFDPRGNGRSDRPDTAEAYSSWEFVEDGRAILEATRTETARRSVPIAYEDRLVVADALGTTIKRTSMTSRRDPLARRRRATAAGQAL